MIPLVGLNTRFPGFTQKKQSFEARCSVPDFLMRPAAWDYLETIGFRKWRQDGFVRTSQRGSLRDNLTIITKSYLPATMVVTLAGDTAEIFVEVNIHGSDFSQYSQLSVALEMWTLLQVIHDPKAMDRKDIKQVWSDLRSRIRSALKDRNLSSLLSRSLDEGWVQRVAELMPDWTPEPPRLGVWVE